MLGLALNASMAKHNTFSSYDSYIVENRLIKFGNSSKTKRSQLAGSH